jgi:hypothetical protein
MTWSITGSPSVKVRRISSVPERVRARERFPHRVVRRHPTRERAERLERRDEDVAILPHALVAAAGENERLGANRCAVPLVDR